MRQTVRHLAQWRTLLKPVSAALRHSREERPCQPMVGTISCGFFIGVLAPPCLHSFPPPPVRDEESYPWRCPIRCNPSAAWRCLPSSSLLRPYAPTRLPTLPRPATARSSTTYIDCGPLVAFLLIAHLFIKCVGAEAFSIGANGIAVAG